MDDPRYVISYGKYVGKTKDSIGSWIAFLSVYSSLSEADYGRACDEGYLLKCGVIAKHRGSFEDSIFGWVPVFDFVPPDLGAVNMDYIRYREYIAVFENNQSIFLKKLVLKQFV